ncbi:hypothetical protein FOA52_007509 [Chlamydomonas sp. UWO 241]|nr:hypothetical protein FOA52_007509 [Chlamydomonas sp. UWO 241]
MSSREERISANFESADDTPAKDSTPLLRPRGSSWVGGHGDGAPPTEAALPRVLESLDYDECDNVTFRSDQASRNAWSTLKHGALKWSTCFALGVLTAAAAFLVNLSVENISGAKFGLTLSVMEKSGILPSFLTYAAFNAALVMAAVSITVFVGPMAAGSGISEVKAFLNGVDVPGIFFLNTLVAKIAGAIGSVAGGLAVGKEGPFVHAGAGIAAIISQGGPPGAESRAFRRLWNDRDRSDMVACGAAAGVAAAFRSPVGGVLFVLEEMTSWWKDQLLWLMFFTTAVVSVSVRVLMGMCGTEGCGFFGSGGFIIFEITQGQDNYEFYELVPMLLLGVVGGLLGSSFVVLGAKLGEYRKRMWARYGVRGMIIEALLVSLLTSVVSFSLPLMVTCQPCPPDAAGLCPRMDNSHSGNFVSFGCASKYEYNDLATIFFNTQDDAIRNLFSSKTKREYTVASLVTFATCFYFLRRGNLARVSHPGGRLRASITASSGTVFSWDSGGDSAYSFLALSNCVVTAVLNT